METIVRDELTRLVDRLKRDIKEEFTAALDDFQREAKRNVRNQYEVS